MKDKFSPLINTFHSFESGVIPLQYVLIAGGNYNRSAVNSTTYVGFSKKIMYHPDYNDDTNENDIAIIVVGKQKSVCEQISKTLKNVFFS